MVFFSFFIHSLATSRFNWVSPLPVKGLEQIVHKPHPIRDTQPTMSIKYYAQLFDA